MTFDAIVGVDTFADFVDPISAIVDECKIHLTEEGLDVRAVDPANVAMVHATLDKQAFESYEADGRTIGVDIEDLEDVIAFAGSGELLHLEFHEATRKLHLQAGGLSYEAALIDPDSVRKEPDLPDLAFDAEFTVEGDDVSRLIDAADMVSDYIVLGYDPAGSELYADGEGDTNTSRYTIRVDEMIAWEADDPVSSLHSLDYLRDMVRPVPGGAEVEVSIADEYPVQIVYRFAEGRGKTVYQLAPRVGVN